MYRDFMATRRPDVKRQTQFVVAVQLDLKTDGFTYRKWGDTQTCTRGDWIVNNNGDTYTVDCESFARTYHRPHLDRTCSAPVWASVASSAGSVRTKEGATHYEAGDYLVDNEQDGGDVYAVEQAFERMYEPYE